MDFQTLFALGMKRYLPPLIVREGMALDLGASGKYIAPKALPYGYPNWQFPRDNIPTQDNKVATIHCYHFLEHLTGERVPLFMKEVERVLEPGGVFNFSVPYYNTTLAVQNHDHKSWWCEDSWDNLFYDHTYGERDWKLHVHFQVVAGINQRNLALVGQLVKGPKPSDRPKWYYPESL